MSYGNSSFGGSSFGGPPGADPEFSEEEEGTPVALTPCDEITPALARLPYARRGKPNLEALISSLVEPMETLCGALKQLYNGLDVENAVGDQLDIIGRIVKQPRNGFDDTTYRRHIIAKIAANRSGGTINELLTIVSLVIDEDKSEIVIRQEYPKNIVAEVLGVSVAENLAAITSIFLKLAVDHGVRPRFHYSVSAPASTFSFDGGAGAGFGQYDDPGVGGKFSSVVE